MTTPHYSCRLASPVGALTLVATDVGLRAVLWPCDATAPGRVRLDQVAAVDAEHPVLLAAAVQLQEYFTGRRTRFDLPLDLRGSDFDRAAWLALADVAFAATATYGEQAARIGRPTAARAVGGANRRNPVSIVLPCHRIVGAGGSLTGFAGGLDAKRTLLDHEARVQRTLAAA